MKRLLALCAAFVLAPALAHGDDYDYEKHDWPLSLVERPLLLAPGMLEVSGDTMRLNLGDGAVAEPITFAPDAYYGINRKLTVGVDHAAGICVGDELACPSSYQDVTVEALYTLMRGGNLEIAARGGLAVPSTDPFALGPRASLLTKISVGRVAVVVDPGIYLGIAGRDDQTDVLRLPAQLQVQVNGQTAVIINSGVIGPLDGFGDSFAVPVGLGALFAINNRIDLGAEILVPDVRADDGFDQRWLIGRLGFRL